MSITQKRLLSLVLAVLMCISMCAVFALPEMTADAAQTDAYAKIKATLVEDDVYAPADNVYFLNKSWTKSDGEVFDYTYGDKDVWGNGVTYRLTYGENAFNTYAALYAAVKAQNEAWASDQENYAGEAVLVFAPGSNGSISGSTTFSLPEGVTDPTQEQMFRLCYLGPQAGKSPVSADRSNAAKAAEVQNDRSSNTSREFVWNSTFWFSQNAIATMDGFAGTTGLKLYSQYNYTGLYLDNFYADKLGNSASWQSMAVGSNVRNCVFHFTNSLMNYNGTYAQSHYSVICGNDTLFENVVITGPNVRSTTDKYNQNQHIYLYPLQKSKASANFYGDKAANPVIAAKNCAFVDWQSCHLFRLKTTGADYTSYTGNAVHINFEDNYFCDVGTYASGTSDLFYIDKPSDATASNGAWQLNFKNNKVEFTEDFFKTKTANTIIFNTSGNPGKPMLNVWGNTIIGYTTKTIANWCYSCAGLVDMSGNLFLDYEGNVQPMVASWVASNYTANYNVQTDLYASAAMKGGIRELFTVRQINGGKDAVACYCNIVQKRQNTTAAKPYLEANLTVWLRDGVTFDAKNFISFENKNVEYLGLYEDEACTSEVTSVTLETVNGLYAKAQYKEAGTTCTVVYKINLPSKLNIVDPTGATEYTFNGTTYRNGETAANGISASFYTTYTQAYSAHVNPNILSGSAGMTDIIVMAPGVYEFTSQYMGKSVCAIGPQFGVNPYDADKAAHGDYANGRSFDPSTEAVFTGFLGVSHDASLSYVFDGFAFTGNQAIVTTGSAGLDNMYQTLVMSNLMVATTAGGGGLLNAGQNNSSIHKTLDVTMHGIVYDGKNVDRSTLNVNTDVLAIARANFFRADNIAILNDKSVCKSDGSFTTSRAFYITLTDGSTVRCKPAEVVCELKDSTIYNSRRDGILYTLRDSATVNANFNEYPSGARLTVTGNQLLDSHDFTYLCGLQNGEQTGSAEFVTLTVKDNKIVNAEQKQAVVKNYQTSAYETVKSFSDASVIENNTFLCKQGISFGMYAGNAINVDNNIYSENTGNGWMVYPVISSSGIVKSTDYAVGEGYAKKNTDFALQDNGYASFSNDGVNLYNLATINAKGALTAADFKVGTGAAVDKLYDAVGNEITSIIDDGTYYVAVKIGSDIMRTKVTLTICKHTSTHEQTVTQPTCDQPGSKNIVCDDCGAIVTADIPIPPNGHQPGEWTVKTPATCVDKGEKVKICSVCQQEVDSREIAATGIHTPSEWIIDTPQDCLNNGSKHKECTVCYTVLETEVIPSTGEHNFVGTVITPATCTTDGVISYTCNGCHTSHNEVIPKTGHQYKATVTQQATCVEDGIMTYECAVCGDSYTEPIPSDGSHDWGDWVNLTPSTCTEQGTRRHICNRCNEIEVEYLPLAAHNYSSEYTIDIQPTGTVKGEKSRHCLVCDARTDITDMGYCQHENTDGQWYIEREATCTLAGEKYQICSDCGDICNITEIPLLPHDYEQVGVLTPNTCTTDGVAQLRCTVCGDETTEALPAFGHTIGYWRVVTPATCSEAGKEERHCVTCDALMAERQIPAKGHGSFDWVVTLEPTCTENGSKAYTCGECGYVEKTETIAALGHSERFVSLVEPTCTTDGFRTYICDRCGYTHQSVAAATGHKAGKWTVQKTATTLGSGLKVKTCTVCGEVVASEVIPQLDSVNSAAVFKDVKAGSWYKPAVDFAVGSGLFTGTGTTTFSPNTVMTRGMLVTVLGRLSGVDASKYTTCYFEDVKSGSYYYGYIEWARQTGVVGGTDTYIFEPDRAITRQEICKIMVTYSKSRDIALKNFYPKKTFKDEAKIAGWAKAYVTSCQRAGIVSGDDKGYFHPTSSATRAEVATILMNYYKNFIK